MDQIHHTIVDGILFCEFNRNSVHAYEMTFCFPFQMNYLIELTIFTTNAKAVISSFNDNSMENVNNLIFCLRIRKKY